MKTLYLKDKQNVRVTVGQTKDGSNFISVWDKYDTNEQLYTVTNTHTAGMRCDLPEGKNFLMWDEITQVTEISENFNQYFNNLNQ